METLFFFFWKFSPNLSIKQKVKATKLLFRGSKAIDHISQFPGRPPQFFSIVPPSPQVRKSFWVGGCELAYIQFTLLTQYPAPLVRGSFSPEGRRDEEDFLLFKNILPTVPPAPVLLYSQCSGIRQAHKKRGLHVWPVWAAGVRTGECVCVCVCVCARARARVSLCAFLFSYRVQC
jgi:hypothetical protein